MVEKKMMEKREFIQEMELAMGNLLEAFHAVDSLTLEDAFEELHDRFSTDYPFGTSFDAFTWSVRQWTEGVMSKLEDMKRTYEARFHGKEIEVLHRLLVAARDANGDSDPYINSLEERFRPVFEQAVKEDKSLIREQIVKMDNNRKRIGPYVFELTGISMEGLNNWMDDDHQHGVELDLLMYKAEQMSWIQVLERPSEELVMIKKVDQVDIKKI